MNPPDPRSDAALRKSYAEHYGSFTAKSGPCSLFHLSWRALTPHLPQRGRLLDLGCGDGRILLRARSRDREVFGVDLAARPAGIPGTATANAGLLPFRDCSFDFVYALSVLQYTGKWEKIFLEAQRVLRPGGLFLFTTPTRYSVFALLRRILILFGRARFYNKNLVMHGPSVIRSVLRRTGMAVRLISGHNTIVSLTLLQNWLSRRDASSEWMGRCFDLQDRLFPPIIRAFLGYHLLVVAAKAPAKPVS